MIRLPRGCDSVRAVLYTHQNMTEEVLFRSPDFTGRMDSLGVAMAFVQSGAQNWDTSKGCQQRFDSIMNDFAASTGHPEIAQAPVIPFGHSAQATFPWNFAAWNPERTLCIISYHGDAPRTNLTGYGRENIEWGRTRNIDSIPALMVMGEYEWWESRLLPALAFRMFYPWSRISFLCDAGKGHFDMSRETRGYMARFIEKALDDPRPHGGVMYSRWFEDGRESNDPHDCFWYQDNEMAERTRALYRNQHGKALQYLGAEVNGVTIPYDTARHIKMSAKIPKGEFTVTPRYTDVTRTVGTDRHGAARPRVEILSGPVMRTGEYTFAFDPGYFGNDPRRLWSGITLSLEADGDDTYKSAVQELNIQFAE